MKSLFTQLSISLFLYITGVTLAFADGLPRSYQQTAGTIDGVVAIVEDDVITEKEFAQIGRDPAALEELILSKLLMQEAKRREIDISDDAITAAIIAQQRQGIRVSAREVYERLIIKALQQQVTAGRIKVLDNEAKVAIRYGLQKQDQQLRLVDLLIAMPRTNQIASTERLIKTIQKQHKTLPAKAIAARYRNVTYDDLGWVSLSQLPVNFATALKGAKINQLQPPVVDANGIHLLTILARKSIKKGPSVDIPETNTSHILIRATGNPNAEKTIQQIYRQLRSGANFAELAKQYSDDTASAANGGNLGWVRPGQMVMAFENATMGTPNGRISRPFRSEFGYHILKVNGRRIFSDNSESALKKRAQQMVYVRKASNAWDNWLSKFRAQSYVKIFK